MGKFATFLIGGAVGAVAGLLLSPRSGAENRALLSEVANEKCGTVSCPPQLQEKAGRFVEAAASTSTKVINTVVDNGAEARKAVAERAQKFAPAPVQALIPTATSFVRRSTLLASALQPRLPRTLKLRAMLR